MQAVRFHVVSLNSEKGFCFTRSVYIRKICKKHKYRFISGTNHMIIAQFQEILQFISLFPGAFLSVLPGYCYEALPKNSHCWAQRWSSLLSGVQRLHIQYGGHYIKHSGFIQNALIVTWAVKEPVTETTVLLPSKIVFLTHLDLSFGIHYLSL
jgi:hypothetical protein